MKEILSNRALGIVIPTHNRCGALLECLAHLEKQTFKDFEVVVVDDGSTDSTQTQMQSYMETTPLAIRYVAQENGGPAKARNLGISLLATPICLFLGDDIFASPNLVGSHLRLHQESPALEVAALGLTDWSATGQKITSFMHWIDESQTQFAYKDLLAGGRPDWRHFYTSNLSAKTELLRRFPFREEFPFAAMEDCELGYRLEKKFRLELRFIPEATARHLHPTSFRQACARMIRVGYSVRVFHGLWPETRPARSNWLNEKVKGTIVRHSWLMNLLTQAGDLCTRARCPNPLMKMALACHYEVGYRSSRDQEGKLILIR